MTAAAGVTPPPAPQRGSPAVAGNCGAVIARVVRRPEVWVAVDGLDAALNRGPVARLDVIQSEAMPEWRSREYLAARALLRTLLRRVAGAACHAPIDADGRGRPVLAGWPGLGISISHDGGVVAACVGRGTAVGVDVQEPPDDLDELVIRRCLGRYVDMLVGLDRADRIRQFAWVWTAQEACVKARGDGLAGRPWSIDVRPGAASGRWQEFGWMTLAHISDVPLSCAFATPAGVP